MVLFLVVFLLCLFYLFTAPGIEILSFTYLIFCFVASFLGLISKYFYFFILCEGFILLIV